MFLLNLLPDNYTIYKPIHFSLSHLQMHFDASAADNFENIVTKGEFLLLPQCFQLFSVNLSTIIEIFHIFDQTFPKSSAADLMTCFFSRRQKDSDERNVARIHKETQKIQQQMAVTVEEFNRVAGINSGIKDQLIIEQDKTFRMEESLKVSHNTCITD